jgi:hypothetical protein
MAGDKRYDEPVFKLATNKSFFEVYDGLDMEKPKMGITITTHEGGHATNRVSFYFDPQTFFGLCDAIISGRIDEFVPFDDDKASKLPFPAAHFGIPPTGTKMRAWKMAKARSNGNYQISIQEREWRKTWDSTAPVLGQASFFLTPFALLSMASMSKAYLQANLPKKFKGSSDDESNVPADVQLGIE